MVGINSSGYIGGKMHSWEQAIARQVIFTLFESLINLHICSIEFYKEEWSETCHKSKMVKDYGLW